MNISQNIAAHYSTPPPPLTSRTGQPDVEPKNQALSNTSHSETVELNQASRKAEAISQVYAQLEGTNAESKTENAAKEKVDLGAFSAWSRESQDKEYTLEQLKTNWLAESERMVEQHYGIEAQGDNTLTVKFDDDTDVSYVASVRYYPSQDDELSRATDQVLTLVTSKFPQGQDGNGAYKPFYGDRTVAHEMVHAVMGQTMNMDSLGSWFKEGAAELIHGADERVLYQLSKYDGDVENGYNENDIESFGNDIEFFDQWDNSSEHYAKGYLATRFMHQDIVSNGGEGLKDVMTFLTNEKMLATGNATIDDALAYLSYKGLSSYGSEQEFKDAYQQQAVSYINNLDLHNEDTGAIGGYDVDNGEVKTAESVVDNSTRSSPTNPLKGYKEVVFEDSNNSFSTYS